MNSNDLASFLLPTALGAVGGGALSAHLADKSDRRNEDPATKRKRVMRNALSGAVMGAGAGAILPGAKLLTEGYAGAKPGLLSGAADNGLGLVTNNLAGLGVAGAGTLAVRKNHQSAAHSARQALAELLYKGVGDAGAAGENARLSKLVEESTSGEALQQSILKHLKNHHAELSAAGNASAEALVNQAFTVNDLLRASGHSGYSVRALLPDLLPDLLAGSDDAEKALRTDRLMGASLQKYLAKGPVSSRVGKMIGQTNPKSKLFELAGKLPGPDRVVKHLPSPLALAEKYHQHINPTAYRSLGRIPTLAAALGIVPAALLANRLQRQVTGQ